MELNLALDYLASAYAGIQEFLFANVVGPILYQFDLMSWAEDAFDGLDWFLFGCIIEGEAVCKIWHNVHRE